MTSRIPQFAFTILVGLASIVLSCCSSASEPTLETMGDKVRVIEAIYSPSSFSDSCELLENSVRQVLRQAPEDLGVYQLANKIELKVTVVAQGEKAFEAKDCSVHELLHRFGSAWGVTVTVKANTISIEGIKKEGHPNRQP